MTRMDGASAPITTADNADNADGQEADLANTAMANPEPAAAPRPRIAQEILDALPEDALFHDQHGEPYVTLAIGEQVRHLKIGEADFHQWLDRFAFERWRRGLTQAQREEVTSIASAQARFDGQEYPVYVRVAPLGGGLVVDLGHGQVVRVTQDGWTVEDISPVRFRRGADAAALPVPERGGAVAELQQFLNCQGNAFVMVVAFILTCFRPRGPYPILEVLGEKGSSKSTLTRVVQALTDPSKTNLRGAIRTEERLAIAAHHSRLMAIDNCSSISDEMSDVLCRLSTGGVYVARKLYTDSTQVLLEYCQPCVINGIENIARRSDLLDRCWTVELSRIPAGARKTEQELWEGFNGALPRLFGAILDALVVAIREEAAITMPSMDRLADAERWVTAAEPALHWPTGTFRQALRESRSEANHRALDEHSELWQALARIGQAGWAGTVPELMAETRFHGRMSNSAFGGLLRRLAPDLLALGIEVKQYRQGHGSVRGYFVNKVGGTVGTVGTDDECGV